MTTQESLNLIPVLLPFEGAGGVYQQPAGRYDVSRGLQQLPLETNDLAQCLRSHAPPGIGVPGNGPGTETRRVEQDDIHRLNRRLPRVGDDHMLAPAACPCHVF